MTTVVLLLLIIRIAYILSANPIGSLTQELVYLRVGDLKVPAFILLGALLVEVAEYVFSFLGYLELVRNTGEVLFYLGTIQALLLLVASVLVFVVVARYTHRGLDRRIRESMETIAYLAGQRRRKARPARSEEEIATAPARAAGARRRGGSE